MQGTVAALVGPRQLELKNFDLPDPGPGEVLLRVRRANVCGSDVHAFNYESPSLRHSVLGHEFVGEIAVLGAGVTVDFAGEPVNAGDRVVPVYFVTCRKCVACRRGLFNACLNSLREWSQPPDVPPHFRGGFATHFLVTQDHYFYKVPEHLADQAVAGANCGLAQVIFALDRAGLGAGDSLVVQGAGGLGLYASAVGKERGARVIVVEGMPDRLELARAFGADVTVDMTKHVTVEERVAELARHTDGEGGDVVLEVTGVAPAFAEAVQLVRVGGAVVSMGNLNVGQAHEILIAPGVITRKNVDIIGCLRYDPWYLRAALQFLGRHYDRYPFDALSDHDYALTDVVDAIHSGERRSVARTAVVMSG